MEVTPEMFAWLSSQKVIDPFKSLQSEIISPNTFQIPEKTIELLLGGKYMNIILKSLQDAYNKFYDLSLDYIENLNQMKEINENDDYISNSIKYTNWHLIQESLNHFGLNYPDETINNIINGDKEILMKVLTEIYELYNEVLKHTQLGNQNFDPNKFIENVKSPIQKTETNNNINENNKNDDLITKTTLSKETKISNNKNKVESININKLDPNKNYDSCNTLLEFYIISICKNFKLKPRQSVALLSNNRKYLSILCNKGTKGNFDEIKNWLNDLNSNIKIILKLIKLFSDGLNISYAIIGTALCSKDEKVVLICNELLNKLEKEIGSDWEWISKEGIDSFFFALIKHENIRFELLNNLFFQIRNKIKDFFNELRKKVINGEKKKVYEFYSSILPILKNINPSFLKELQSFLFEICLNEKDDISYSLSILGDAFFYFYPLDDEKTNILIDYFIANFKNEKENIYSTGITQIFCLMERFGEYKIQYAPILYKNMVFLLIENYDNEIQREFILLNFEKFFNNHQTVPIDILLEPYLEKLLNIENYSICDLLFLFKIIEHPRLINSMLISIIQFILKITLNNKFYNRTANLILSLIFEKNLINKLCNKNEIFEISKIFSDYIKTTLKYFLSNSENMKDPSLLETSFDILNEEFMDVNKNVHKIIIESIKIYRKEKNKNSSSLLALLWCFNDHDEVLLNLEEEFRPKYDPIELTIKKEIEEKEKKINKNYVLKNQKLLTEMIEKRKEEEKKRIETENKKNEKLKIDINNSDGNLLNKNINLAKAINEASENIKKKKRLLNKLMEIDENQKEDDIFLKHGIILSPDKKNKIENLENDIHLLEKIKASGQLIYPEGTIIKDNRFNKVRTFYFKKNINQIYLSFINFNEEENREKKAIEGFNIQYKKNIIFYFRTYSNERTETISKTNLLRMYRDRGYNKYKINLDELNLSIKTLLNEYLKELNVEYYQLSNLDYLNNIDSNTKKRIKLLQIGELDLDFFKRINVNLSYIIYQKLRQTLTISQCYELFINKLTLGFKSDVTINLYEKFKPVLQLINNKRNNNEKYNLPPGFKIIKKEIVEYKKQLPELLINSIGENKYICYEIINDILFDIFNSSSIETYVQINNKENIEIDPLKIHKWSIDITLSYINLNVDYKKEGIEVADILEEKLTLLCKGKDKDGNKIIHPIEKNKKEIAMNILRIDKEKEEERKKRNEELKQLIEENNKIKEEKKKQELLERKKLKIEKEKEEKKKIELLEKLKQQESEAIQKKYEQFQQRKKKIEDEENKKRKKELLRKKEKEEKEIKKLLEYKEKSENEKEKLERDFKLVKKRKQQFEEKQKKELLNIIKPKKQNPEEIKEIKEYYEFEKKLNQTMRELMEREDIKNVIEKYKNHFECIYNIYSKIGFHKIGFYSNESIKENEFKEFLINFTVLGLLISVEQMKWIFKKIANEKLNERNNQSYFDFNDFILSIGYLSIFSKFTERSRKILPSDIENTNGETIENFIEFLGLKTPFNKLEMENFINDRRSMDFKNLIKLQKEIKNSETMKEIKGLKEKENNKEKENEKEKEKVNEFEIKDYNENNNEEEKKDDNDNNNENINNPENDIKENEQ